MEKNKKIQIYCLLAASFVIGMFGAVCLYLGITGEYNDAMGYFNTDSLFAPVVYCCLVGGPLLGVAGWIIFRDHRAPDKALPGGIVAIAVSCVSAAMILYSTVSDMMSYIHAVPGTLQGVTVITWILSFLAAASLLVSAFFAKGGETVKPLVSLLAFTPVLYCTSEVLLLYFDQSIAVNSPIKFICQLAYLSYMLVFTAEAGLSLGKGNIFPRYIFTLCASVAIGGACSVAAALATATGAECVAIVGVDCVAKLGLFFYVCMRLVFVANIEAKEEKKPPKAVKKQKKADDTAENIDEAPLADGIFEEELFKDEE